jgi:hypothetical protein
MQVDTVIHGKIALKNLFLLSLYKLMLVILVIEIQRTVFNSFSFNLKLILFCMNSDETRDDQREPPRERQRLQLQPRTKPVDELQPLSGSSSSVNNVAANAAQSSLSNADESSSSVKNTSIHPADDSSINENRDEYQQQESGDSNDNPSRANTSDEQSTIKPSRGAGASIFGGAKPVDTTARELEIEKKLKELQMANSETSGDNEEKAASSK